MRVVVTGAAGFLGARLAARLVAADCPLPVTELLLVDVVPPPAPPAPPPPHVGPQVTALALELGAPGAAERVVTTGTHLVFHLAAVVSGHAEADLEVGYRVNLDATRALAEQARRCCPRVRFVFASTVGVYGGALPEPVTELTAPTPRSSYGAAKAMCELLLCDYSRRGLLDARVLRLPTVTVRAGAANRAVTSYASAVVREPLAGLRAACPVPPDLPLWVASPAAVVRNLLHAGSLPAGALGAWPVVNLPGLAVSAREMVAALRRVAGDGAAGRVRYEPEERAATIVRSLPPQLDAARALALGFHADTDFEDIIRQYIRDDLKGSYVR